MLICVILLYSWGEFLFTNYVPMWRQWFALGLVAGNAGLYYFRYQPAILVTGLILLLATFNLLSFFASTYTWGMMVAGFRTPEIQPWSLLLLVIYLVINIDILINWYLDRQEQLNKKNENT